MKKSIKVVGFTLPALKAYYETTKTIKRAQSSQGADRQITQQSRVSRGTFVHTRPAGSEDRSQWERLAF